MSHKQNKFCGGGKLHLIDRATYEHAQNDDIAQERQNSIQNSKYKRTHRRMQYSLLDFIKVERIKHSARQKKRARFRRVVGVPIITKHRGKTREGGKKRHRTRLKKSILLYRQQKLRQERLSELSQNMESLTLQSDLHSRRFRDYCDNCTTPQLAILTEQLLRELNRFQKRAHEKNPIKAHAHRRFVLGFREVQSYLQTSKVKLVIIAPDCEPCSGEAGLDQAIANVKSQCQQRHIPYVFSLRRRQLAYALYKKVPISCLAVLNFDGANAIYAQILLELQAARNDYKSQKQKPPLA